VFKPGKILTLKEPRSPAKEPFAYDRIEVIGASPLSHADIRSEWTGTNAQGVIVKPLTDFGSTLDEPMGRLVELYAVESIPENRPPEPEVKVQSEEYTYKSPEDVFAEAATEKPLEPKKAPSPLADG